MRTGRWFLSVLLSAALLPGVLTACRPAAEQPDPSGASGVSMSQSAAPPVLSAPRPASSSHTPDIPEEEPGLEWDPDYKLDIDYPKVAKGKLELPVSGATGYTSVTLPLWKEIPEPEPEPELPAEPEPAPPEPVPPESLPEPVPGTAEGSTDGSSSASSVPDASTPEGADASGQQTSPPEGSGSTEISETSSVSSAPAEPAPVPDLSSAPPDPAGLPSEPESAPPSSASQPAPPGSSEPIYAPGEEPVPEPSEPEPDPFAGALAVLAPGTPFTILEEEEEWWRVESKAGTGWIQHRYCLINLPDVIPSMVYNATNSYDSRYVSVGKSIPKITGAAFYPGAVQNPRLNRREFMMPVLYSMAPRICQAQQAALAQGNTLVLYEGYRPHKVQRAVYRALSALSQTDAEVREGIASAPWSISWFIAGGYSNHQRGFAMDVSLARVERAQIEVIGKYKVLRVQEYQEYTMPTAIHELSKAAATFTGPVATHSPTAWRHATLAPAMNAPALALQRCCTGAGLTPLASEWWHFNDLETRSLVLDNLSIGNYEIGACLSTAP